MHARQRTSGIVIVYAAVFLVALMAFVSLAVDWGRVQTAKSQLQAAADAAARYAAAGLRDGTAVTKALAAASQNSVDGTNLTLLAADVELGTWDLPTNAFVVGGTPLNAVRVTAQRIKSRGTAVPLVFGRAIGINTFDVKAVSVSRQSSLCAVGINSLSITGNGVVRRTATEGGGVTAASNGTYSFASTSNSINGDVFYRTTPPTGTISGKSVALPYDFAYATPVTPGGVPNYGALSYSSGTLNASGTFAATSVAISGTTAIVLYGDTYIYCSGTYTSVGNVTLTTNGYHMTIFMTSGAALTFNNNNPYTLSIYAPASDVALNGPGTITGSVIGKTLTINGPLEFTGGLPVPAQATGGDLNMSIGGVQTMK